MSEKNCVLVLGGDGFCGWPTSLHLASLGLEVVIVDNLSRRKIDLELSTSSIVNIASIQERVETANRIVGKISFELCDIAREPAKLREIIRRFSPKTIVHFAEQRAAPYSMIGDSERRYTVDNNISGTHNVCSSIVEVDPSIHLVHLGTMGVYGYSKDFGAIPEGYLSVHLPQTQKDVDILYPANPGSVYHMTKCLDQLVFQFYNKNWGLKVTDLHQGIVWGIQTAETSKHQKLANRFDYDGVYGTVLNRFLSQAANGHDLTVYGTGGQKRAFIHISDTARCIGLSVANSPIEGARVRIFNQVSEVRSVKELAQLVANEWGVKTSNIDNPRKELKENDLEVSNQGLRSLGFDPITLETGLLGDVKTIAEAFRENFDTNVVLNSPKW